ncbi:hypothetical protein NQ318_001172 [Aromia moschata]|uniref:Uncharacterized protein n=1 Tax=Aromia moschata TaxID=1265417 RepID=A0AAV8ZGC0_9CUCU|nr:hypothetical protein NQ318_001172 [Aromia moschata]
MFCYAFCCALFPCYLGYVHFVSLLQKSLKFEKFELQLEISIFRRESKVFLIKLAHIYLTIQINSLRYFEQIEQRGPIEWPPRPPDLTPLDYLRNDTNYGKSFTMYSVNLLTETNTKNRRLPFEKIEDDVISGKQLTIERTVWDKYKCDPDYILFAHAFSSCDTSLTAIQQDVFKGEVKLAMTATDNRCRRIFLQLQCWLGNNLDIHIYNNWYTSCSSDWGAASFFIGTGARPTLSCFRPHSRGSKLFPSQFHCSADLGCSC